MGRPAAPRPVLSLPPTVAFTTYLDKIAGRNVVDVRGGNIGIEIRMGVNYTEAVVRRGESPWSGTWT